MADFVRVPHERVPESSLQALLEEFASRDGTDYGLHETPLERRVSQLQARLGDGSIVLLFDAVSESWDLVEARAARELLGECGDADTDRGAAGGDSCGGG